MLVNFVGYLNYVVFLFLSSGGYILWIDRSKYTDDNMKKERTAATWSAWINLSLGGITFIGSWIYKRFFW
ncbi:CLC_0170 family protein [Paenibacillus koleovorans]|uniref:CLC_0170 family protein n=1 Tax=Paenibacillus koleovorans TaxID=121608 RepID=UPI000FD720B7|nr:CLC_0170 family protein [Paenibacillus koleovorans]